MSAPGSSPWRLSATTGSTISTSTLCAIRISGSASCSARVASRVGCQATTTWRSGAVVAAAAGVVAPLLQTSGVSPELLVLAVGAGSVFCSHVNDSAFWMFKEFFGLSMKQTFQSWTVMETVISIVGLAGVLLLDAWWG